MLSLDHQLFVESLKKVAIQVLKTQESYKFPLKLNPETLEYPFTKVHTC
jgi:hypothetical protein